jgi:hypothetical protein
MTGLEVYLWMMLDSLKGGFLLTTLIPLGVLTVIRGIITIIEMDKLDTYNRSMPVEEKKSYRDIPEIAHNARKALKSFVIAMAIVLVSCFIPSTKQMAVIWILPKVANSETVEALKGVPLDMVKYLKTEINGAIEEALDYKVEIKKETSE